MSEYCKERHAVINQRLDKNENVMEKCSERIDNLEQFKAGVDIRMEHLIKEISSLVNAIKWFMGLTGTTLLGFFIWYIQQL